MQEISLVVKSYIINPEGKILVLRRSKSDEIEPLTWDLPGGGVDYGEDPIVAAAREVKEESGLIIKKPQIFTVTTSTTNKFVLRMLYFAYTDNVDVVLSDEHDVYKWVSVDEFSDLDAPNHYKSCVKLLPKSP